MKTFLYEEAMALKMPNQQIVPTKATLWKKTNNLFVQKNTTAMVQYYENLGGRWKIQNSLNENKKTSPIENNTTKIVNTESVNKIDPEFYGIYGVELTPENVEWLHELREFEPDVYRKMLNWD